MSSRIGSRRSLRKAGFAGVVAAVFGALMVGAPSASAEFIPGAGNPYNSIFVSGNDLVCQIVRGESTDFDSGQEEDYCGTFVYTDFTDELYGNSSAGPSTFADFEQVVAQTLTGTGDPSNPWVLTSVVEVPRFVIEAAPAQEGSSLLTITEVDTYTVGDDFYRTDLTVHNDLTDPGDDQGVTLYHVGDCQLEGSDTGFAVQDSGGNGPVFCTPLQPTDGVLTRAAISFQGEDHALLGFIPVGTDSNFREAIANDGAGPLYTDVNNGNDLSDECTDCTGLDPTDSEDAVDNGVGLSWSFTLPPGGSEHRCFYTVDSSQGNIPDVPASCVPGSNPPPTVSQKPPPQCKLRISRARVFLFRRHPRLRLVARYRSAEPADVLINFIAIEGSNKVNLGDVTRHFKRHGLFRLREELSQDQSDTLWQTHSFIVHFKIPGEPGFCERKYKKELTVPRIVDGQRVVFQSDSKFGPGSPGHPGA